MTRHGEISDKWSAPGAATIQEITMAQRTHRLVDPLSTDTPQTTIAVARVLIVARQTADSEQLQRAVAERARRGRCRFTLLVPAEVRGMHRVVDPEEHGVEDAEGRIAMAIPRLSLAAGAEVGSMIGSHNPLAAVADAINLHGFEEVIVSMLQPRLSHWLHLDLARKVAAMGVPVTTVVAASGPRRLAA
jgi:cell pole-organizing protein PopZ